MVHNRRKFALADSSAEHYDTVTGFCKIEFFAAGFDKYRVAPTQHIPTPWPHTVSRSPPEAQELLTSVKPRIEDVLSTHNIIAERVTMQLLSPRGNFKNRVTLIIDTADSDIHHMNRNWKLAATEVQLIVDKELAQRSMLIEISVEIRNSELMNTNLSSAIAFDSPEHKLFDSIKTQIALLVEEHCTQIACISYHMRGRQHEKHNLQPTIIITIEEGTTFNWLKSYEAITEELDKIVNPGSPDFSVEMIPGRVISLMDTGKSAAFKSGGDIKDLEPRLILKIPEYPDLGSSISPLLVRQDGTLGPWVFFRPDNSMGLKACFLTCYHYVSKGEKIESKRVDNDHDGINIKRPSNCPPIKMYAPGFMDAVFTKKNSEKVLKQYENPQKPLSASEKEVLQDHRKMIEFLDANAESDGLGSVIYASGSESINENRRKMDWALVELHDSSLIRPNKVVTMLELQNNLTPRYTNMLRADSVVSEICDVSTLIEEATIYKRGRNGVRSGEFSALDSTTYWEGRGKTSEMSALPFAGGALLSLAEVGDSGSMVHNDAGQWVGMVIATTTSTGETHITPAQDLIDAIKKATGGHISLPNA